MKTIQAVADYFPDKNVGGIQIRLSELLPVLKSHGVESTIVAPHYETEPATYSFQETEVYRYPVLAPLRSEPTYGAVPHSGFDYFANWLKQQDADIYHQHQWNPTCGLPHLQFAKELGLKTIVSIRYPKPLCKRETLMFKDEEACDGKIDVVRCSQCCDPILEKLPSVTANALSQLSFNQLGRLPIPDNIYSSVYTKGVKASLLRPLTVPASIVARQEGLRGMVKFADRIVTLSQRLYEMLLLNGVPEEKLVICKTGVPDVFPQVKPSLKQIPSPLEIVFLGRWHRTKGIHILVKALKSLSEDIPVHLTIHGFATDTRYQKEVLNEIGDDSRIKIEPPLSRENLTSVLSKYDVMAVPSQWFDVRPMVVLEAFAAGLPVLGSDLGGIPELIQHEVDGLLIPTTDVQAWATAIAKLAKDMSFLNQLRQGIQPLRTMSMEALDTQALYQSLLT